jgi:hypothetical protein
MVYRAFWNFREESVCGLSLCWKSAREVAGKKAKGMSQKGSPEGPQKPKPTGSENNCLKIKPSSATEGQSGQARRDEKFTEQREVRGKSDKLRTMEETWRMNYTWFILSKEKQKKIY